VENEFLKKTFIVIVLMIISSSVIAETELVVNCRGGNGCELIRESFSDLAEGKLDNVRLYNKINYELNKPYYKELSFELMSNKLVVNAEVYPKIIELNLNSVDDFYTDRLESSFPFRDGSYYDEGILNEYFDSIRRELDFKSDEIDVNITEFDEGLKIGVTLLHKKTYLVDNVYTTGIQGDLKNRVKAKFASVDQKDLDSVKVQTIVNEIKDMLFHEGYWGVDVSYQVSEKSLYLAFDLGKRYAFSFHGNSVFTHRELMTEVQRFFKGAYNNMSTFLVEQQLDKFYKTRGVYNSAFKARRVMDKETDIFFVSIDEGHFVKIENLEFIGNVEVDTQVLQGIFDRESSVLLSRGYFDPKGLERVTKKINEYYVKNGYIYSMVDDPVISFSTSGRSCYVSFKINENSAYKVGDIFIKGLPSEFEDMVLRSLTNKKGQVFDVTEVDKDLETSLEKIREKGYYFANYLEKKPQKIVRVNNDKRTVDFYLSFVLGKKVRLGEVIVTGNLKTKDEVILRELDVKPNEIVTPRAINYFVSRLRSLGLFAKVNITPFSGKAIDKDTNLLNFIVKVKEKDYGQIEIAPGYRTDLGYKLSTKVSKNNINGMDRSVIFKLSVNRRTTYSYLVDRRRTEEKDKEEGSLQVQYVEPYLFGSRLSSKTSFRFQRKRYASFDADIWSFVPSFTKTFFNKLTLSLQYELDDVRQFDGILEEDIDRFRIGAITPSVTLDLRDNPMAPTKGAWFSFDWEFANPYFGAQKEDDLTINYNKALLRTYLYYPVGKIVMATSITVGAAKNFARDALLDKNGNKQYDDNGQLITNGYIPSLKVYRLSGLDILRGFSDSEANVLSNNVDVSDYIVRNSAYLMNFKLEPRYYLSDNTVGALFFDAGRIFIDTFRPMDLRTSAGLSFKILTPIGSLDFDYGVKLQRKTIDGSRETFGRFHVSIGQF
jgi:outer membrane protein insertion porin family